MTAPAAPGTSTKLLIAGGASAGVGLLIKLILPLTYGQFDTSSYDQPWETKKAGSAVLAFLGAPGFDGMGLADLAVLFGGVALALSFAVRGFEPKVPRPAAPQAYPQYGAQPGQYAQPQTSGQQPGYPQAGQQYAQPAAPAPEAGGYPPQQQQQWGGAGS
ncbi:MAG: hypothetical protein FWE61_07395 [Micrococcales bacterium]|nr:hypothetical protein [Micrococcales bacterium]